MRNLVIGIRNPSLLRGQSEDHAVRSNSALTCTGSFSQLLRISGDVAGIFQCDDDRFDRLFLVVERDRHGIGIHVCLDFGHAIELLYGRTGRNGGAASDDTWG